MANKLCKINYGRNFNAWNILDWGKILRYNKLSSQQKVLQAQREKIAQEQTKYFLQGIGVNRINLSSRAVGDYFFPQRRDEIIKSIYAKEKYLSALEPINREHQMHPTGVTDYDIHVLNNAFEIENTIKELNILYDDLFQVEQRMNKHIIVVETKQPVITPITINHTEKKLTQQEHNTEKTWIHQL